MVEAVEARPVEAEGLGGQRGAQGGRRRARRRRPATTAGRRPRGAGRRIPLRQIHAAHARLARPRRGWRRPRCGCSPAPPCRPGAGAQAVSPAEPGLAALAQVEQTRHLAGAHLGHGFDVRPWTSACRPGGAAGARWEGRQRPSPSWSVVRAPVASAAGRAPGCPRRCGTEGALPLLRFGELEAAVGGPHHGVGRAEVAAQGVQPAGGGGAGGEVGVDVGAAEGVDGLLRGRR